ncbi:hypothetical protein [Mesorhizobium amorphae]
MGKPRKIPLGQAEQETLVNRALKAVWASLFLEYDASGKRKCPALGAPGISSGQKKDQSTFGT